MAHSAEILVNGVLTQVTEFYSTAQQIDDVVNIMGGAATPQAALAALGAGVRPNLFINPAFSVNQRGQAAYSSVGYSADGWYNPNNTATITINQAAGVILEAKGLTSAGQVDTCWNFIPEEVVQKLVGKTCTISCLFDPDTLVGSGWAFVVRFGTGAGNTYVGVASTGYASAASNLLYETFTVPENTETIRGIFTDAAAFVHIGDKINPTDVKFEEGPNQTLAYEVSPGKWAKIPQPGEDYTTQLLQCQRYFQLYSASGQRPSNPIDCRPTMRIPDGGNLTQGTIVIDGVTYYYNSAELSR